MSTISCSKDYTLTVASAVPVPFAYFKCDELAGTGIVDSIAAYVLVKSTVAFPTEPGFIGTSVRIGAYPPDPFFKASNFYAGVADMAHWDLSDTSWTLRCWANVSGDTVDLATCLSTPDQFQLRWLSTGNAEFNAYLGPEPLPDTISSPMADSAWHRVICWYDKGVGIGLKIDNNASVTMANTDLLGAGGQRFRVGGPLGYGTPPAGFSTIDEVAIWKQKLTDDEMLYDWNGGAGRTYP